MTLKERLEEAARNGHVYLPGDDARKLLALLKAAKDFAEWTILDFAEWTIRCDGTNYYDIKEVLRNAIHAVEGTPERVAGRPERMPPGGGEGP